MNNMGGDSGNLILLKRIKELETKNTELQAQVRSLNSKFGDWLAAVNRERIGGASARHRQDYGTTKTPESLRE